ncbi:hypothetical protein Kpol_1073p14 [Vanderwaltozyma polyspora DSM 70294]|uniref:RNA helicase n=1 Tax=Vanderwaltozyma polyspora (strain ATCC 22028 / DSM 70294 / BCRC 21397 / CBS 2163 / NBRC 10782 / NRRL Y-8283 / UCD 57-17) TaxID=436907 RepID=A7TPS7_VANPO|nr:uncharacterized protein Kpol_1073p14 [Vanderwaltozyma polyspora DSM 70294]EDO15728.1 hypothetical protein Kpol_1073p14 [Vanderwaltozyma polyspora DSM 70294]
MHGKIPGPAKSRASGKNKKNASKKANNKAINPFKKRNNDKENTITFQEVAEEDIEDDEFDRFKHQSNKNLKTRANELLNVRKTLPVFKNKDEIMKYINKNQVTVLIGETGSGKSTQIPQFLLDELYKNKKIHGSIAVTQPRRVAAVNLATRVSQEHGCNVGDQVGYSVRFDNSTSNKTRLKYLTDGMLLRELMMDKELKEYNTVIIDEAHERTVLTDLILGFLKYLLNGKRKDLKVIVMSATLQADKFSSFFDNAPILFVEGRKFNVSQYYLKAPCDDIVDAVIRCCVQINLREATGDVLCFLPGQEEIDKAVTIINKIAEEIQKENSVPLMIASPLYAALSPSQQAQVFLPLKGFKRKIIFSTNIAETSVTVSGVRYVVDSGLRKVKVWRHQLGLATLLTVPISQASAMQRSGRAGREDEGKSFRLYCEQDFSKLPTQTEPEIARSDITSPVLLLKKVGIDDILNWTWFEKPGKDELVTGLQELYQLGALSDSGKITNRGNQMALLPLQPHLSSVLIKASEMGCLSQVIDIVSCLSVENLLLNPQPEERDVVNERRYSLCIYGRRFGDLIMLKELFDVYFYELNKQNHASGEKSEWCKQLCISYRGFKNVVKVREQIRLYCKKLFDTNQNGYDDETDNKLKGNEEEIHSILKCFLTGFSKNTAIGMPDRSYRTVTTGETISVHPSSMLFLNKHCPGIMYTEYVFTTKGYARNVSRIELSWLQEAVGNNISAVGKTKIL